jgi:hypothetical protein
MVYNLSTDEFCDFVGSQLARPLLPSVASDDFGVDDFLRFERIVTSFHHFPSGSGAQR